MKVFSELWAYRQMIASLVKKDLRGRYKASVLGFLWTFINPLLQLGVYTIVFGFIMRTDIDKYYLHLFVALIPWLFFATSVTGGSSSIIAHKDMVQKIYFPREVIPISYVTSCFVNMLLSFVIVLLVVILSGVQLSAAGLLLLPVVALTEYLLALGFAMILSALTVYLRDLEHIMGIVVMAWMYLTPVIYSINAIPENMKTIFMLNPMTPVIIAFRDILYYGRVPDMKAVGISAAAGLAVLALGFLIFGKLKKRFAEEL